MKSYIDSHINSGNTTYNGLFSIPNKIKTIGSKNRYFYLKNIQILYLLMLRVLSSKWKSVGAEYQLIKINQIKYGVW